jgi:hypothetical protein
MICGLILSVGERYPLWPGHSSKALTRIVDIDMITRVSHPSMVETKQPRRLRYRSQLTYALFVREVRLPSHGQIIVHLPVETCRAHKLTKCSGNLVFLSFIV